MSGSDAETARVVVSDSKAPDFDVERSVFESAGVDVELVRADPRTDADVVEAAGDADALVADAGTPLTAAAIEGCSALRVIVRAGIGVDNIDLAAARAAGVVVSNVPDYCPDEVSTHALAFLLSLVRGVHTGSASTAAGEWDWQVVRPLYRPGGLTLGVVGCGRIGGQTVAKASALFDEVLVADPYVADGSIRELGGTPVEFETLLERSEAVSVHTPLTPETRGLFDADAFATVQRGREQSGAGPDGVVLVNTARGAVVDADALEAALDAGVVRAAGLDVLPEEPPPDDRLVGRADVVVTPHVGWYSEESKREVRRKAAEEVLRVLEGEPQRYAIDTDG